MLIAIAQCCLLKIKSFFESQDGQGMAEYGIIIAGIAVVVAAVILLFGGDVSNLFSNAHNTFK